MSKTIQVTKIIAMANDFMKHSPDDAKQDRLVIASFVINILHQTNNYAGFSYKTPYSSPNNDPSRIFFYTSSRLTGSVKVVD